LDVDWSQILEKPDRAVKVPGQLLLQQRNKIEALQKELEGLRAAKAESEQKAVSLNLRIENVLADLESRKKTTAEQEETIDKLKEVLAGLEDNLAASAEESKQDKIRAEELERTQKEMATLKDAEIAEQSSKIADLEAKLKDLEQISSKAQDLEMQVQQASDIQRKLSEKEAEVANLQAQVSAFEKEKSEMEESFQKKLELLEEEKRSFEEQYKLKEAEIAEKDETLKNLQAQASEASSLQEQLDQKTAEASTLQQKVSELDANLSSFAPAKSKGAGKAEAAGGISGVKSQIPWKSGTGIYVCPECGSNRSEDVQDKSKVLYVAAGTPIYAKKKRCLNCGIEWSVD
jgi:chromosome segregation ATPase